jgi:xanthine dehydrogenase accessory factor
MREILDDIDRWVREGEDVALATLVELRGSAPRQPGARLGLTRSGKMTGSVSGGCVENDVFERALQVLDDGRLAVATYGIADEIGFQVGLSCGGSIDVLIEPFAASAAWQAVRDAVEGERPAVLGIALAPARLLGRKLAMVSDEAVVGSLDPALDERVAAEARRLLATGGTRLLVLGCGGEEARIFLEAFPPPLRLFVVGATHTAVALSALAKRLGFHVTIIDGRGAYATRERFPDADELLLAPPDEALAAARLDAHTYVVVLTHDPRFDLPALARVLRSGARYVGVMGSRGTHERRVAWLREQGFTDADLARIRAPIGLDLGGRTPEETALAILAEMQAVRYGRDARPLAARRGAIHGDGE